VSAKPASGAPAVSGTVLAFDFGTKRIGVAVGDYDVRIAHALTTITAEDNQSRFSAIAALIGEWRPVRLVVGLPAHADGTEHEVSALVRRFVHRLNGRFGLETALVDERLTSSAAESRLRSAGLAGRQIDARLDAAAAQEILDAHFAALPAAPRTQK
jgi:putative holliday junction resolvase